MWPWLQARVAEGRGFHVDVGAFSTPITGGGAGTIIDIDQPEFALAIPDGTAIMPIRIDVAVLPGLQTTDSHETEIVVAADIATLAASDGTLYFHSVGQTMRALPSIEGVRLRKAITVSEIQEAPQPAYLMVDAERLPAH